VADRGVHHGGWKALPEQQISLSGVEEADQHVRGGVR
jgi:hypothetical protein